MDFKDLPRVYEDQPIYGAVMGKFTFIITEDEPNKFTASVKVLGASPFDGTRHDLGGYGVHESFTKAQEACRDFYRHNKRPQ